MHTFPHIAALGACIAAVAAVPMPAMVYNTVTQIDVVTDYITETVWVDPPSSTQTIPLSTPTSVAVTTTTSSSIVVPTPTTTSSTTSAYVAPAAETPVANQPAAVIQTPAATPTPIITTTTSTPAAAVTVPTAPATTTAQQSSSSSSSGKKNTYTGDVTFYDVGQGSCGNMNSDSEMVLAMAVGLMNKATMCGKTITISYGGSTHTGTIVDTCMGCADGAIDLSPALFKAVVPNGDGRVSGVEWWFN